MSANKAINLIAWQNGVGDSLKNIIHNACGKHVKRSRSALFRRSKNFLIDRGWDEASAVKLVRDAFEMAELEILCDAAR